MERTPAEQELHEALATLAAEDLPKVIEEARAEARDRVRPILADALAEAMLKEARGRRVGTTADSGGAASSAGAADLGAEAERDTAPTGLYVFCVVAASAALTDDLEGLKPGTNARLVRHNDLAAVVSDVSLREFDGDQLRENLNDMQWLERTARAHERVLETVGQDNTLVPMRLCSIYRAEHGVAEMLTNEASALEEALGRLRGKAEWGVKVFARADAAEVAATAPTANGSGADYMRHRQTERHERQSAAQRQHDACISIHDRLAELAAEALTAPPQSTAATGRSEAMVLNGVYLVDDAQRDEFLSLVSALQEAHEGDGLELEPTGPWPAYNFVPSETEAAA